MRVLAYLATPIKVGDLIALLNSEGACEMDLRIEDDTLVVTDG